MPALPNAGLCRSRNDYDQLLAARYTFSVVMRDPVVETNDAVYESRKKYDTPASAVRLRHSAVCNVAEMT
jgi:hypothetical protein